MGKIKSVIRGQGRPPVPAKSERAQVSLRPGLLGQIKTLALSEQRSVSNMLGVLVERGLTDYVESESEVAVA